MPVLDQVDVARDRDACAARISALGAAVAAMTVRCSLIEDSDTQRAMLGHALEQSGHRVASADTGAGGAAR